MRYADSFKMPEHRDRPRRIDRLWMLQKNTETATCELWTHPAGGEMRVDVNGESVRSKTGGDAHVLLAIASDWREDFVANAWYPVTPFAIPPYDGDEQLVMLLYAIRHPGGTTAMCEVWTHKFGGQLRFRVALPVAATSPVKSKVMRLYESTDPGVLMAYAEDWRREHLAAGWTG